MSTQTLGVIIFKYSLKKLHIIPHLQLLKTANKLRICYNLPKNLNEVLFIWAFSYSIKLKKRHTNTSNELNFLFSLKVDKATQIK